MSTPVTTIEGGRIRSLFKLFNGYIFNASVRVFRLNFNIQFTYNFNNYSGNTEVNTLTQFQKIYYKVTSQRTVSRDVIQIHSFHSKLHANCKYNYDFHGKIIEKQTVITTT